MKRVFLLLTFIGVLFASPEGFAKPPKHITKTIKYENGDKYVGTIQIWKFNGKKKKYRHGDGIMYYANGNRFEGTWGSDVPIYGTVYYANGNLFKGSLKDGTPYRGQFVFANQGFIKLGDKLWKYSDNSSFKGDLIDGKIYTGQFDCPLTTTTGDRFTGTIKSGKLDKGTIVFANGDTFEGSFNSSAPFFGEYRYGRETEIVDTTYKWIVPAGCTFNGDVRTLTGMVDTKITDINGNQFIGKLAAGLPYEGTMSFANGIVETGKWQDGMSPSEYKTYLAKQEAERKRQEAIKLRKSLEALEKKIQKDIAGEWVYSNWISSKNYLWLGAVFKLSQLFIGKKVYYSSQVYTCENIRKTESGIEMSCRGTSSQSKTFNFEDIHFTSDPSNITKISTNYPENLGRVFFYVGHGEDKCVLVSDRQNIPIYIKDYYIRKFGNVYGIAVLNKKIELGMTVEMVQAIRGTGNLSQHVSEGQKITILNYGGITDVLFATVISPIDTYTFVNGRLTGYTTNNGQSSIIWN